MNETDTLIEQAEAVTVTALVTRPDKNVIETEEDCLPWSSFLQDQTQCIKYLQERFAPLKKAADERHARICAKEKARLAPFMQGKADALSLIQTFTLAEQERRRQAQAEAEARAKADAIAAAKAVEDDALAKKIEQNKVAIPAPVVDTPVKVPGVSTKMVKKGRVTDMALFVRAVASGKVPYITLEVNEAALNKWVQATDGAIGVMGLDVYEEAQTRGTGRR